MEEDARAVGLHLLLTVCVFSCVCCRVQCTNKNLTAAASAAAAASASAAGGASRSGAAGASAARPAAALLAAHTLSIQDGLDPFHQRLNACLDYKNTQVYEMDGYMFQCFAPPNLQGLDPAAAAAAAQTPGQAAQAQAQKAAAAARAAQAVSSQQQQQQAAPAASS